MSLIAASIFNFLLVIFILWYFGRKPIAAFLSARSEAVAVSMREAEVASAEANKLLTEWEGNWKSSEAHAQRQFEEAKAAMKRFRESALSSAATEAERVLHEASLVGKSEVSRTKEQLRKDLVDLSIRAAQSYLEGHLTDKDRHKLVTEYVEKVTNGAAG